MSNNYWGYHLMINCAKGNLEQVRSGDNIKAFSKELVKRIDMVAFGEPFCENFANHDPSKSGYSLCQMIETSNICGHFVDESGDFYIDIFSCKPFTVEDALDVVNKYFTPERTVVKFFKRDANAEYSFEIIA